MTTLDRNYSYGGQLYGPHSQDVPEALLESLRVRGLMATEAGELVPPADNTDALPDDFPGKAKLGAGGYATLKALRGLDRDALIAVEGIGEKTADAILEALKG